MKSKKLTIITSFLIFVINLVIFTILQFHLYTNNFRIILDLIISINLSDLKNYVIIICSGFLTSAFVTLLISISEYRVAKVEEIGNFCKENFAILAKLRNPKILNTKIPIDKLSAYYAEVSDNKIGEKLNKNEVTHNAEEEIKDFIWEKADDRIKKLFNTPSSKMVYLHDEFNSQIDECDKEIADVMQYYMALSKELNSKNLSSAYAKIDFIFYNKKIREKLIYKTIVIRQYEMIKMVKDLAWRFNPKTGEGNIPVMLTYIDKIQKYMYSNSSDDKYISYYKQYVYELELAIHNLLKYTYGKNKYKDPTPQIKEYLFISCSKK